METVWYWRRGGHIEQWNVYELSQRALESAGSNTHVNACPGPRGGSRNSPTYHLSHDPREDFVVPIPRTLGSAVRSPILQREVLPESGREQQARRGIPIMAGVIGPDQQKEARELLPWGAGRNEYPGAPRAPLPRCTVNGHGHKHHAWEANGYQGSRF